MPPARHGETKTLRCDPVADAGRGPKDGAVQRQTLRGTIVFSSQALIPKYSVPTPRRVSFC
jgi:hypothetical protein